jgi:hypothetical protein
MTHDNHKVHHFAGITRSNISTHLGYPCSRYLTLLKSQLINVHQHSSVFVFDLEDAVLRAKKRATSRNTSCIRPRRLIRGVGALTKQATNNPLAGHRVATPTLSSPLPHPSNFELNSLHEFYFDQDIVYI